MCSRHRCRHFFLLKTLRRYRKKLLENGKAFLPSPSLSWSFFKNGLFIVSRTVCHDNTGHKATLVSAHSVPCLLYWSTRQRYAILQNAGSSFIQLERD